MTLTRPGKVEPPEIFMILDKCLASPLYCLVAWVFFWAPTKANWWLTYPIYGIYTVNIWLTLMVIIWLMMVNDTLIGG